MDIFGESDFESFSDSSSDDLDDIFSTYSGKAQSILSSLDSSIGKIDDFLSFERSFVPGDIVCSTGDPSRQMGLIADTNVFVHLENVFGKVIKDINTRSLDRMRLIMVGDYVIHGPWLGRVDKVVDCIGILFDDGTMCEVMATDQVKLVPVSPNFLDDSLYPYHPRQRVKVGLSAVSKSAGWLCGMSKKNHQEGTICSVEAGLVYVDWLASAVVGTRSMPPPPCIQDPKNLTVLTCSSHSNWQVGDWCILQAANMKSDKGSSHIRNLVKECKEFEKGLKRGDFNAQFEEMFVIVKKKTKVDVLWQDGSSALGLDSHSLVPVSVMNAHDFFPQQLVLEKTSCDDLKVSTGRRWGFVRCVDANERTVKVSWKSIDVDLTALDKESVEETVSAYELIEHPDFTYGLGDIVFRLEKNHSIDQSDASTMCNPATVEIKDNGNDADENPKRCFLSCIGHVIGFKDGDVEVQWASGITNKVAPYKICRVEKDDGSVATHVFHGENSVELDHETIEDEKESLSLKETEVPDINIVGENSQDYHGNAKFLGLPQAAIGFFTSIVSNFFGSHGSTLLPQPISHAHAADEGKIGSLHGQEVLESFTEVVAADFNEYGDASLKDEDKEASDHGDIPSLLCDRDSKHFKQFDIVGDCSDHHFVDGAGKGTLCQAKRGWLKNVQKEWSILEQNLPETVYVRIYEERMDLLRAAIVGAPGTPYHDGLFLFDIFLPPDYPNEPPMLHYHSWGLRLNPNLYESGKICLSLLNTWTGTGSEVWNSGSSTILQVLLSLQALVLNEKPYFNEAGYDKQIGRAEGEKNSVSYNENAFLVTCKSMLYLLRKPPKHFEGLVEEHFSRRSQQILSTCKAYMEDGPVNFPIGRERPSMGFKIMLAKLFPKLVEAFSDKGIDCSGFIESNNELLAAAGANPP
ncbi:hypothetical protein Ancab_033838 [Ancistrocladus abbreviatus]